MIEQATSSTGALLSIRNVGGTSRLDSVSRAASMSSVVTIGGRPSSASGAASSSSASSSSASSSSA
jgi:hypothetical protein